MSDFVYVARLHAPQRNGLRGSDDGLYEDYTSLIANGFYRANRQKVSFFKRGTLRRLTKEHACGIWNGLLENTNLAMRRVRGQMSDFLTLPAWQEQEAWSRYHTFSEEANKYLRPLGYEFSATYEGRIPKELSTILNETPLNQKNIALIENPEAKALARSLFL